MGPWAGRLAFLSLTPSERADDDDDVVVDRRNHAPVFVLFARLRVQAVSRAPASREQPQMPKLQAKATFAELHEERRQEPTY